MSQTSLTELLRLTSAPVAITFVDAAPPGVPHVSEPRRDSRRLQSLRGWGHGQSEQVLPRGAGPCSAAQSGIGGGTGG